MNMEVLGLMVRKKDDELESNLCDNEGDEKPKYLRFNVEDTKYLKWEADKL